MISNPNLKHNPNPNPNVNQDVYYQNQWVSNLNTNMLQQFKINSNSIKTQPNFNTTQTSSQR